MHLFLKKSPIRIVFLTTLIQITFSSFLRMNNQKVNRTQRSGMTPDSNQITKHTTESHCSSYRVDCSVFYVLENIEPESSMCRSKGDVKESWLVQCSGGYEFPVIITSLETFYFVSIIVQRLLTRKVPVIWKYHMHKLVKWYIFYTPM